MTYAEKTERLKKISIILAEADMQIEELNRLSKGDYGEFTPDRCRKTNTYIQYKNSEPKNK